VIFTIPHELNELWRENVKVMTQILFDSCRETLFELLEDEKYLGARPGIIATLHTWTKTLDLHPHIHCLVTGGGLNSGEWISVSHGFLFPFAVARDLFRGKLCAGIEMALSEGLLKLPEGMGERQLKNLLNRLGRKKWSVKVCEKCRGEHVVSYLARYLRGGPIGNSRIREVKEGKVTFNVGRSKKEWMVLSIGEFIGRFIQHIPLVGSIRVRSWGLYSNASKGNDYAICRDLLGQAPLESPQPKTWQSVLEEKFATSEEKPWLCPICGKRLIRRPLLELSFFTSTDPPKRLQCVV
jgi:hypothetical protein